MTKVIIIGGGIAGLSAGCHLQKNGYTTEIFELYSQAGGLCTSWKKKGYTIDGCIHWWVGINPSDPFYPILDGLFDMKNWPMVVYEEFFSVEEDGEILHLYGNLDQCEKELKTLSPEDSGAIDEMISGARELTSFATPADKISQFLNAWKISIEDYAQKFKNPFLRKFLHHFTKTLGWNVPMAGFLMHMATFHNRNAGYPKGGAEELIKRLVHRYEALGGMINFNSRVAKILTDKDQTKGIQLQNGTIYGADFIVSAADGRDTVVNMLGGQYVDDRTKELYFSEKYVPKSSQIYLSLGVARKFSDTFKPYVLFALKKPLRIADETITDVGVTIHNFDPTAAPQGKTVLTLMIRTNDSDYWVKLRNEKRAEYKREKEKIAKQIIEELENHFGDIKDKVEMIDMATPATYIRFTNNWNGAPMAWQDFSLFINKPKRELKGLKNFLMCGHWVGDYGLDGAAKSGNEIAEILCKQDGKKFKPLTTR